MVVVIMMMLDIVLVIYTLIIGCRELSSTKHVMNMKTYRGYWQISVDYVAKISYMIPVLIVFEMVNLIFMGKACDILYE